MPCLVVTNFGKSLKANEKDLNEEHVYAECSLVLSEPQYTLSNTGSAVKSIFVSECELYVTKNSAKQLSDIFNSIYKNLIELEKKEINKYIKNK